MSKNTSNRKVIVFEEISSPTTCLGNLEEFTWVDSHGNVLDIESKEESTTPAIIKTCRQFVAPGGMLMITGRSEVVNGHVARFIMESGGLDISRHVVGINIIRDDYLNYFSPGERINLPNVFNLVRMNGGRCVHVDIETLSAELEETVECVLTEIRQLSQTWNLAAICEIDHIIGSSTRVLDFIVDTQRHDQLATCRIMKNRYGLRGEFSMRLPDKLTCRIVKNRFM